MVDEIFYWHVLAGDFTSDEVMWGKDVLILTAYDDCETLHYYCFISLEHIEMGNYCLPFTKWINEYLWWHFY